LQQLELLFWENSDLHELCALKNHPKKIPAVVNFCCRSKELVNCHLGGCKIGLTTMTRTWRWNISGQVRLILGPRFCHLGGYIIGLAKTNIGLEWTGSDRHIDRPSELIYRITGSRRDHLSSPRSLQFRLQLQSSSPLWNSEGNSNDKGLRSWYMGYFAYFFMSSWDDFSHMVVILGQFQRRFQLKFDSRSNLNGFNCHKSMNHQQFIKRHHIFCFVYFDPSLGSRIIIY
jgi:hypothetical protein